MRLPQSDIEVDSFRQQFVPMSGLQNLSFKNECFKKSYVLKCSKSENFRSIDL